MSNASNREIYEPIAVDAAIRAGIPVDVFLRLITQESGWNPTIESEAGALGIAQFMPGTAQSYGIDPLNPYQSLYAAAEYLRNSMVHFGASPIRYDENGVAQNNWQDQRNQWTMVVASYNAGIGGVEQAINATPQGAYIPGGFSKSNFNALAWTSNLPDETQTFVNVITPSGSPGQDPLDIFSLAEQAGGLEGGYSTTKPASVAGPGQPLLPQEFIRNERGQYIPNPFYNQELLAYYEAKDAIRTTQLGPYARFFDETMAQIEAELQMGQLDLSRANAEIGARLRTFETVANTLPSLLQYAVPTSGYLAGREPGGTLEQFGFQSRPANVVAQFNPMREAMNINSFASGAVGSGRTVTTPLPPTTQAQMEAGSMMREAIDLASAFEGIA